MLIGETEKLMARNHERNSSVAESIDTANESGDWMSSYLRGDIELVGGNGKFRRTEDATTKQTKDKNNITEEDLVNELENDSDFFNEMMNAFKSNE